MTEFYCDACGRDLNGSPKDEVYHASGITDGKENRHVHLCYYCYFMQFGKLKRIKRRGSWAKKDKYLSLVPPPSKE